MVALLDQVRTQLGAAFAGRAVILAGGVAAAASQPVDQLRGLGAERFLIASSGAGSGGGPDGADVELVDLLAFETAGREDVIASFREEERAIAAPYGALLDAIRRFDPEGLSFFNMNTPADYEEAVKRWQALNGWNAAGNDSVQCTVELFGVARLLAQTKEVALSLPEGATLARVYSALAEKLPVLANRVIAPDGSSLLSGYACNVNGLEFVRVPTAKVNSGDRIFIISADAGG